MPDQQNPLLKPSDLPYGLPDYAALTPNDIREAVLVGIEEQRGEWEAVAANPEAPSVANTVVALDRSGATLRRAESVLTTLVASVGGEELQRVQGELTPVLAAHEDTYRLDRRIYDRYLVLQENADLEGETARTVREEVRAFRRSGTDLPETEKAQLRHLNVAIADLETKIEQRIAKQLAVSGLAGQDLADLGGLSEDATAAYVALGKEVDAAWFIPCRNYTSQPAQASLALPAVRRALLEASLHRGETDPAADTRGLILELVRFRAQKAELLGFPDHLTLVLEEETVPGPRAVRELLTQVGSAAARRLEAEEKLLEGLAEQDPLGDGLEAADLPFYEDQLSSETLGIDAETLRPFLQLQKVLEDGVFWSAQQLYGITFHLRPDLRGWDHDVQVWEVREEDGSPAGLFLADYYARPGKQGGAWMAEIVAGHNNPGGPRTLPIVSNDANFTKPQPGAATLLSWDEVETVFHEFGHALHGLFSRTQYQSNAGTAVPRDFVELPSQVNEMWAYHPSVIARFARHHKTGATLPAELVTALSRSKTFGQGRQSAEYVQSAALDVAWHSLSAHTAGAIADVAGFEDAALAAANLHFGRVPPRYKTAYFAHAFAGGYDGAYYAYLWAEVLTAQMEEWFRASAPAEGGLVRRTGQVYRNEVLSRGGARDPLASFKAVVGAEPDVAAVLRRRGLV